MLGDHQQHPEQVPRGTVSSLIFPLHAENLSARYKLNVARPGYDVGQQRPDFSHIARSLLSEEKISVTFKSRTQRFLCTFSPFRRAWILKFRTHSLPFFTRFFSIFYSNIWLFIIIAQLISQYHYELFIDKTRTR